MPTIHFPQTEPLYTPNTTVAFEVVVDGVRATCEISEEALQDHFGAVSRSAAELVRAFKEHRAAIEAVGRFRLPGCLASGRGLLVSGDF